MGARGGARRHPVCCVLHPPSSRWVSWSWQPERLLQPGTPRRGQAVSAATICLALRALPALHHGGQSLAQNACGTVPLRCPSAWCHRERMDGCCGVPELSWCSPCPGGTRPLALQGPSSSEPTRICRIWHCRGLGDDSCRAAVRCITSSSTSLRGTGSLCFPRGWRPGFVLVSTMGPEGPEKQPRGGTGARSQGQVNAGSKGIPHCSPAAARPLLAVSFFSCTQHFIKASDVTTEQSPAPSQHRSRRCGPEGKGSV